MTPLLKSLSGILTAPKTEWKVSKHVRIATAFITVFITRNAVLLNMGS